jgi:hypothetical protein
LRRSWERAVRTRTPGSSSPLPRVRRSMRRTSSTAISSPCSSEQDCSIYAGTISGTRASRCFPAGACTPSSSSISQGTPAYSSPSTATRTGCPPWASTLLAQWTKRSTRPTKRIRRTTRETLCSRDRAQATPVPPPQHTWCARIGLRRRKDG